MTPSHSAGPDVLEAALRAQLGGPLFDTLNERLAAGRRAQEALARVRAIPRRPHVSQQGGGQGRAYTRGWESVIAMIDNALDECCVCGSTPVHYRNFREQPFCRHCANCECAQDPCTGTRPDTMPGPAPTSPDALPDAVRPPLPTRADTVRTIRPDTTGAGVRVEYRARVPRCLLPAALMEATQAIADARGQTDTPTPAPDAPPQPPPPEQPARCTCGLTGRLLTIDPTGIHVHDADEDQALAELRRAHDALTAAVDRVRTLHRPAHDWSWTTFGCTHHGTHSNPCAHCGECHPCTTLRLLDPAGSPS